VPESTAQEQYRGVRDRGLPPKDQTIEPRKAAQLEAARLKALAPGTYRHPDGSPPTQQDFESFSRQYDQMANERHVWRFAKPDGSTYDLSWKGLGTGSKAQASASLHGHRVIGEVTPGQAVQATPAQALPSLGQAERPLAPEPLYSPPPLVQAEPPFDPLPSPKGNPPDDDKRGTKNKLAGSRSKAMAPPRVHIETWMGRLLDPPDEEVTAADPKEAGEFANPDIPREARERLLGAAFPDVGYWLQFELTRTVSNFLINLKTKLNTVSELAAAGIITPGQKDQGTLLENGSQRNAFRHTFGQALITKQYGRKLAVASGFAHEDLPKIDTTRRYFFIDPGAPSNALFEADTVADQLNNEIGRRIAEGLGPAASNIDLATAVLNEFKDKGLYVATFEMKGVVKLSRVRLTPQEFSRFTTLLRSLKENGRAK
jgi:hypothetical protein